MLDRSIRLPSRHPNGATSLRKKRGFVLVIVVWGVGVMSLLALTVIRSADIQGRIAANDIENARVEYLAEAAVNIAIIRLISFHRAGHSRTDEIKTNGEPSVCRLLGAIAAIDIEDEGGKIDLNAASSELLTRVIEATGVGEERARNLAASIIQFRSIRNERDMPPHEEATEALAPVKHSLFETTYELEQVGGFTPDIFQALRPYLTVDSRSPGIDPNQASAGLMSMLSGGPSFDASVLQSKSSFPSEFLSPSNFSGFTIHAEVLGSHNAIFVREVIVDFPAEDARRVVVREWHRGDQRFAAMLKAIPKQTGLPPC